MHGNPFSCSSILGAGHKSARVGPCRCRRAAALNIASGRGPVSVTESNASGPDVTGFLLPSPKLCSPTKFAASDQPVISPLSTLIGGVDVSAAE